MDAKKKKPLSHKKELRTSLVMLLYGVLANFKDSVHDKKMEKLVKKASKLLADGLHHNKSAKPGVSKAAKKPAPAKKLAKKTIPKKPAPKKAAKKK